MSSSEPEGQPLRGRRIVITRSESDAAGLAARLRTLGAEPVLAPAIEIELSDPAPLKNALAATPPPDWIIFTSRNAVEAVFRATTNLGAIRVAAVGPATADQLRRRDIRVDLLPDRHLAEGLLEQIGDVRGKRVLFPRADIARRTLPDGLRERGAIVDEVEVYRTRGASGARPDLATVDAITFTSGSTVRNFLENSAIPANVKVVCIGPVTADAARELGVSVSAVANHHTEDGLIAAIVTALAR